MLLYCSCNRQYHDVSSFVLDVIFSKKCISNVEHVRELDIILNIVNIWPFWTFEHLNILNLGEGLVALLLWVEHVDGALSHLLQVEDEEKVTLAFFAFFIFHFVLWILHLQVEYEEFFEFLHFTFCMLYFAFARKSKICVSPVRGWSLHSEDPVSSVCKWLKISYCLLKSCWKYRIVYLKVAENNINY